MAEKPLIFKIWQVNGAWWAMNPNVGHGYYLTRQKTFENVSYGELQDDFKGKSVRFFKTRRNLIQILKEMYPTCTVIDRD